MNLILLTNDDGVHAAGLEALAHEMRRAGEVVIVAPERDNSAASHSLTMSRPLRVRQLAEGVFSVDGTPTDCVAIAVAKLLDRKPQIIIAGINPGANLGDDIAYSGTVAAAMEGAMLGINAMAVSQETEDAALYRRSARVTRQMAARVLESGLPADTILNINLPAAPPRGILFTRQGRKTYEGAIQETFDPWKRKHYWIGGGIPSIDSRDDADGLAVRNGYISVTPLHFDLTNHQALHILRSSWKLEEADGG
ncbi:MAG: 5'/3'-nucleotidase SurE [Thermodesulfobacteriota bacterium]